MNSLVGLTSLATGQNNDQNDYENQSKYMEDGVIGVCRMLMNKEKEMSPSRHSSTYARLVIEKLFQNRSIDLCGIMPANGGIQAAQHPFHLVHEIIHSRSLFFETILEADDGLSNELWLAICQQADLSFQPTIQSADSVLMQTVSFYVTRLLPTEPTPPSVGRVPLVTEIGHRKHTPLDLFLPTSPVLNSIKLESQEFFSSSLHPRHLTIFCNFVSILCTTSDFPSANRLMMLRYLLKQFHVFCLYDVADQDMLAVKSSLHCRPPFSAHLYTFLYTFLEQCPTASIFKDFVQCWMTFCRPWRYADALLTLSNAEFLRGPWMPFIRVHEKFYRILLGKILRRVAVFDLNMESVKVMRAAVEFSWKEPMVSMLRELGVNARPHTRQLLETVCANVRPLKNEVNCAKLAQNQSFWDLMFGAPEPPVFREKSQVIECVEGLLSDADANMGTHFIAQVAGPSNEATSSALPNRTPQLSETPKRAPSRLLPDHVRDPVTGLMYLTELGRRQVWSGERRFDFSMCSQLLPQWKSLAKPYEFPPLVVLLTKINEYLNRTALVSTIASEYSKDTVLGSIARTIMDPPCPNPSSPLASPVFSKTLKVTPPALRIRILANYGVLLGLFIVFLFARYGIWALIPVLLTSFICAMFLLAAEDL
uniref:TLDc domain-containing protein n=1 Tax=Haemonchus contortus TaxID=6289 RepID=A0A7I4XZJ4_HAECO